MQLHRLSLPWLAGAAAILATAMPVAAYASEAAKAIDPATLPVETFFSHAKFGGALISPNGEQLAVLTPVGERIGLSVINLKTHDAKVVAADPDWDVARVNWINDKRLAFGIRDTKAVMAEAGSSALYAVNSDGSLLRRLDLETNATGGKSLSWRRGVSLFETLQDGSNDVLVISNERGGGKDDEIGGTDVYRMDTLTGRKKILTFENPGHVVEWVVDNARVVRAAVSWVNDPSDAKLHIRSYYRDSEADKWHVINDAAFDAPTVVPIGFDADNKTMYVSARADKDTTGIYKWDFAKNALGELALRHPRADADSLIHDFKTDRVVGVAVDAMKPETYYFDEDYARLQATIDSALPDTVNVIRNRGDHALVVSYSDVNPGDVYLYTDKTHSLEPVLSYKPNFPVAAMSAMQVVEYKARDGLPIPAYLTTPKTKPAKQLPLVVFVHGGPHARDNWGFDPFVQHLASRGYAVLQPEFRMSTGLGWKLFHSGWKQWGLAMQDDVTDGVNYLVKQGIVDPQRVCIMGASYGGYATMYGLAKDPDLYKCGVNFVGVTDIRLMFNVTWGDTADSPFAKYALKDLAGDPDKDIDYMKKSSALENADKIKAPVLMAYGTADVRVPMIHGEKMRDKLLKQGNTVEWMAFVGEGHGWNKDENKFNWAHAYESFIDRYIGDKAASKAK